jgi:cytoskeletal protein CcmA (bactofilin family)
MRTELREESDVVDRRKYMIDKSKKLLVVRKGSVVDRHLRFNGKIVAGMNTSFWGNLEAEEIYLGKGCYVGGKIVCSKIVVGAESEFTYIDSEGDVLILDGCKGGVIKSEGDVKIRENSVINVIESNGHVIFDGNSKIGKVSGKKVLASREY